MKNFSRGFFVSFVIVLILFSQISAQSRVNEWKHYTSIIDFTDIIALDGKVFCSSSGGVVEFNLNDKIFQTFATESGLSRINLEAIATDENGNLWVGSGDPIGEINIFSPDDYDVVKIFDSSIWNEDFSAISGFATSGDKVFAIYRENTDYGILEFNIGNTYAYKDFYVNFPITFQDMKSISIAGNFLYAATTAGLICADFKNSDLKNPDSWKLIDDSEYVTNVVSFSENVIYGKGKSIYAFDGNSSNYFAGVSGTIESITVADNSMLVASPSGLYQIDSDKNVSQLIDCEIKNATKIGDHIIANTSGKGLFVISENSTEQYIPNTMISNANTALCVDDKGRIIGGSRYGFSIMNTDDTWKNIVRTGGDIAIHDEDDLDWRYFFADSIPYSPNSGSRIYSVVNRSDGSIFASIYGASTSTNVRGAVIKFNPDDIASYELFDSTNSYITHSAGYPGGNDHFYAAGRMQMDKDDNLWICNQYAASNGNVIAVLKNDNTWQHFSINDSESKLTLDPTCIAFDSENRVWIGSESNEHSNGKIAILDYNNTLDDKSDDIWYSVTTSHGLGSNNIFDLAFDKEGVLFIMTENGIQEAELNYDFSNGYFSRIDANPKFSNLSFAKENVIKVDGQNNKWFTTASSGVLVYTWDNQWLNNYEGYNIENSGLPTNEVQDIDFIEDEGLVVMTTSKGISILKSQFSTEKKDFDKLKIFPMPFKIPAQKNLVIEGLLPGSDVKILTLDGTFIRKLTSDKGEIIGTQAFWDGRNENGKLVSSGVYLCAAYTEDGKNIAEKIAVIRK